ncbi:hypothetical protein KDA_75550 [Dictyobacter alpinus]|uniref:Uncharacterized protein n=1 Tax=Dictyobacter alpinus TaxID=2014873 RepID=A0A402BL52_9CHLR|nr:hypothetical protein KDA_75550 [Dictyobacter alpinus]
MVPRNLAWFSLKSRMILGSRSMPSFATLLTEDAQGLHYKGKTMWQIDSKQKHINNLSNRVL